MNGIKPSNVVRYRWRHVAAAVHPDGVAAFLNSVPKHSYLSYILFITVTMITHFFGIIIFIYYLYLYLCYYYYYYYY